jgi:hypothetical protein
MTAHVARYLERSNIEIELDPQEIVIADRKLYDDGQ